MNGDDTSFSAAKLRDYIRGEIRENSDLYPHTGMVEAGSKTDEMLSFMESIYDSRRDCLPPDLQDAKAARDLRKKSATTEVGKAVEDKASFAVGLTDRDAEISPAKAFSRIQSSIVNSNSPYTGVMFGGMNDGKTSTALLYVELWRDLCAVKYGDEYDPVLVTNASSIKEADYVVQTLPEFRSLLFGTDGWFESNGEEGTPPIIDQERPVMWLFDEASTHLDARTNSYEVASEYTPLLKRFAKVRCDSMHIAHSGKDVHAELRRPTIITEFIFKRSKKKAEIFEDMDDDRGVEKKYELTGIPHTSISYDKDDLAPWAWE